MEELSLNNIMLDEEVENLFSNDNNEEKIENKETSEENDTQEKKNTEATEVDADELFAEEPESVGSEENQEGDDTNSEKKPGASPKNNFYSSIAKALKEDGVFPDLDDEDADKIVEAEDFAAIIEKQIQLRLDEKQKRIDEALTAGVDTSIVKQYENTITYLDNINEENIIAETDEGESLRKQLIYQDYINRGYTKEQASRKLQKSIDSGSDIEDAKEALEGNKEFFKKNYQKIIDEAKEEAAQEEKGRKEQAETLKKSILEDKKVFGELELDKATRQRVYDNISKPIYKDKDTGELFTAIQKYEMENKTEFLKNVGLIYTLTDGFKNLDGLVKGKVKKEVKKGLRELEHTLNNTQRTSDGNLRFVSGVSDDSQSFFSKWDLDV